MPRYRTQLEFTPNSIELLQDLREKSTKQLNLKISSRAMDELLIEKLNQLFTDNQGSCPIQLTIHP